ncbi:copper chaperone [Oleomonas cavernae]|uniref:Copper chaperone n=1 Tax=Oleomonas cavernae TaxID=2320859 RepID=A0A418WDG0_9PROT|nr:heavy-metal-associated domain-containing protein [Oleomonas cavernae]RJF88008.1 copper chaperone [Oleomonas cavernae]
MQTMKVTGMTCGGCAKAVERAVGTVAPNAGPKVDLAAGEVSFADGVDANLVAQAIQRAGFEAGQAT